mmetsp:Transcript_14025/g.20975  ORF Transcript_14025/g.20975 Transcript_14025/m.20975 type:complete len:156 (-) Transcript_14025:146-613(-)
MGNVFYSVSCIHNDDIVYNKRLSNPFFNHEGVCLDLIVSSESTICVRVRYSVKRKQFLVQECKEYANDTASKEQVVLKFSVNDIEKVCRLADLDTKPCSTPKPTNILIKVHKKGCLTLSSQDSKLADFALLCLQEIFYDEVISQPVAFENDVTFG